MATNPENYKPKHHNRVYYPNSCSYCFQILDKLLQCGSCSAVSYCSRQHQLRDWSFHRPTCVALNVIKREVQPPQELNVEIFFKYRVKLLEAMAKFRNLPGPECLTEYEKQICTLPWVCAVCYSGKSSIGCDICESIIYCSIEHKKQDEDKHKSSCRDLQLCRIFSSLGYAKGYELKRLIPFVYQPIRAGIKQFPKDVFSLVKLIQNQEKVFGSPDTYINMSLFVEPYIPAALIIHTLDTAGYIKKRHLLSKSHNKNFQHYPTSSTAQKCGTCRKLTMDIHFAIADDYEVNFQWVKIAQFLKDWLNNIEKVRVLLIGPMLKKSILIPFERIDESIEVFIYQKAYHEVVNDLPAPDVIILLECNRTFNVTYETKIWDVTSKNALFKYTNIPVILCDGRRYPVTRISESLSIFEDIKCLAPINLTDFTDRRMTRIWRNKMTAYMKNRFFTVFAKK